MRSVRELQRMPARSGVAHAVFLLGAGDACCVLVATASALLCTWEGHDNVGGQLQPRHGREQRVGDALELRARVLAPHGGQHGVRAGLHGDVQVGKHAGVAQHLRGHGGVPVATV